MLPQHSADIEFPQHAFLVRDALRQGHTRGVLAHPRWNRPFRGVRTKTPPAESLLERALQYLPRLRPGERFSHLTALALLGCPIRVPQDTAVDVSAPHQIGRAQCRGVDGHRHSSDAPEYHCSLPDHPERIPVTAPLLALQQSAALLPFPELVVALDYLLREDPKRYDPYLQLPADALARFADAASGRGVVRFRAAAAVAKIGAESRMETLMRLGAVRVGLPELHLQAELRGMQGERIGRFDAVDDTTRTIYEYDGEQHFFSREQRRRDPRKHQAARDAGWRIRVFYSEEVVEGPLSVGREMLAFSGRAPGRVPAALAKLLDERHVAPSESAQPLLPVDARYPRQ